MAFSATQVFKPLSVADAPKTLSTLTILFGAPKTLHPFLSIPSKPTKTLHISCSHSSPPWISLKKKLFSQNFVALVASTSDWAQQEEEENRVVEEEEEEGEGEFNWENQETENRVAWESGEEIGGSEGEDDGGVVGSGAEEDSGVVGDGSDGDGLFEEPLNEDAKLFVGNLPYDVDSEKLAQLFDQAGVVEVAEVIYNRDTDQSRGFGFVTMSTVEEAEKAVETFHRFDLDGRLLTVNKAAPRGARPERSPRAFEPSFRIYVGNLPWQVDDGRLEQVFSEHGKVVEARVVYDRESGRSRGFGFVTMASQTEMDDAIAALDGQSLDGRALRVNVAEERPRRGLF